MPSPTQHAMAGRPATIDHWIKTPCGRAKYDSLAARPGAWARLRLGVYVLLAALRDWPLPAPPSPPPGELEP